MFIIRLLLYSSILLILLATLFKYIKRKYLYMQNYWKKMGIPYKKPLPIIGNTKEALTLQKNFALHLSDMYNDPDMLDKSVIGIFIFDQPALIIREPEIIKSVLIKDFEYFTNRYVQTDLHTDALANYNLFFSRDALWKKLRVKISPMFTTSKMKQIYNLMMHVGQEFEEYLLTMDDKFVADVNQLCGQFVVEVIGNIGCGIKGNTIRNPKTKLYYMARNIFTFNFYRSIEMSIAFFIPKLSSFFKVKFFTKEFSKYMRNTINYVIAEREKEVERKDLERHDLIDILIKLRNDAQQPDDVFKQFDCLVAQSSTFLVAGVETSTSTMSFTLYELAKHTNVQEKLRLEICQTLLACNGELSYDQLKTMNYLNMILDEVLRLYPILPFLDRQYNKQSSSEYSLQPYYDYTLLNGMPIYIPIYALHRDPKYWDKPNEFNPERFSAESRSSITPMTYLPFGGGQRKCIGTRIALLQTKVGLIHFLKNHYVTMCDKTPSIAEFDVKAFTLQLKGGAIHLNVHRDNLFYNKCVSSNNSFKFK